MSKSDIRWKQRYKNYLGTFRTLRECTPEDEASMTTKDRMALIAPFVMLYDLSWKLLRDYLIAEGHDAGDSPKPVYRAARRQNLITNMEVWLDMVDWRNKALHTYDSAAEVEVSKQILHRFLPAFEELSKTFEAYYEQSEEE